MKAAAFIYLGTDGKVGSIADTSLVNLEAEARKARVTGMVGKTPIERGVVIASWRTNPAYRFIAEVQPVAKAPKIKAKA